VYALNALDKASDPHLSLTTRSGIHKRQTIVIVDDEPHLRNLVRATIDSPVYQVIEACDGEEAWILIKERKPALVLLDLREHCADLALTAYLVLSHPHKAL